MDEISAALAALGIDASHIHTEPFGPAPGLTPGIAATPARAPHPPAGKPGNGPTIEFARSDLAIPWGSDYGSLLELAEACDVPVRWSCRTGVCHTCETTLIAGDLEYNPDPVEPPARRKRTHLLLTATRRRSARSVSGRGQDGGTPTSEQGGLTHLYEVAVGVADVAAHLGLMLLRRRQELGAPRAPLGVHRLDVRNPNRHPSR